MEAEKNDLQDVHSMYMLDPGVGKVPDFIRSKHVATIQKKTRAQLTALNIHQLRAEARKNEKLRGVWLVGAHTDEIITAILTGERPGAVRVKRTSREDKLVSAFGDLASLFAEAVYEKLKEMQDKG